MVGEDSELDVRKSWEKGWNDGGQRWRANIIEQQNTPLPDRPHDISASKRRRESNPAKPNIPPNSQ